MPQMITKEEWGVRHFEEFYKFIFKSRVPDVEMSHFNSYESDLQKIEAAFSFMDGWWNVFHFELQGQYLIQEIDIEILGAM